MPFVYALELADGKYYIGSTEDVQKRLKRTNGGKAPSGHDFILLFEWHFNRKCPRPQTRACKKNILRPNMFEITAWTMCEVARTPG